MSDDEMLDAYAAGSISRRAFVRRLIAGGLSLTAAVQLAETLSSPTAAAAVRAMANSKKPKNPKKPKKPPKATSAQDGEKVEDNKPSDRVQGAHDVHDEGSEDFS